MDSQIPIVQNAENRFISAVNAAGTQKLEFVYDCMGRRVEKKVYNITTTPEGATLQLTTHHRFVYDGFKLVEKLNAVADNAIINKFVWQPETFMNLDVPLSVSAVNSELATVNYYYFTDANKNIGQLMDASGNIVAKYEYSPFGKITSQSGDYAAANPFRFSSEYADDETGLVYYNYRYYSPELGGWLKRDPIGEEGFRLAFESAISSTKYFYSLYKFCNNNSINTYDLKGLIIPLIVIGGKTIGLDNVSL